MGAQVTGLRTCLEPTCPGRPLAGLRCGEGPSCGSSVGLRWDRAVAGKGVRGLGWAVVGCGVLDRFAALTCQPTATPPVTPRHPARSRAQAEVAGVAGVAGYAALEPAGTCENFRRVKSTSLWLCTSLALARDLHSMGIPLPSHYRQWVHRGDGRYMWGHWGHKHCRQGRLSADACKRPRSPHLKHRQSMDNLRQQAHDTNEQQ